MIWTEPTGRRYERTGRRNEDEETLWTNGKKERTQRANLSVTRNRNASREGVWLIFIGHKFAKIFERDMDGP